MSPEKLLERAEDRIAHLAQALHRIRSYMTPEQLRKRCDREYGLQYEEALEMAYENVIGEAASALKGMRRLRRRDRIAVAAEVKP